jgi:hypothetical protein
MHPYQGLLEGAIERLGDTTASLGQAYAKLEACRTDFPRIKKFSNCTRKYSLTTKARFEESKDWLLRVVQDPISDILTQLENRANLLEQKKDRMAQNLDHDIEESKKEEAIKSVEHSEKEKSLSELRTKKRHFASLLQQMEDEINTLVRKSSFKANQSNKIWFLEISHGPSTKQ